jgi:hypothetical protein
MARQAVRLAQPRPAFERFSPASLVRLLLTRRAGATAALPIGIPGKYIVE